MGVPSTQVLDAIVAISTALAAIFAAWSAMASRSSAKAAEAGVQEARRARKEQLSPRFVLERNFLDLDFKWPPSSFDLYEDTFMAREDAKGRRVAPTFTLSNFGEKPGLEVEVVFALDDGNEAFDVPEFHQTAGYRVEDCGAVGDRPGVPALYYPRLAGGFSLPLYRIWTVPIPFVANGHPRKVEFPMHLLNRLFLRGIQRGHIVVERQPITMTVTVRCHTVEAELHEAVFRFYLNPFSYPPTSHGSPVEVHAHVDEIPVMEKERATPVV